MKAFPHNPTIFWRTPKIFGYILAFLSFLTLTFLTVKFFAPDVNSDAATKNISAGSTTAGYTLSAGFEDSVSIPVTPTSSQAVYSANHAVTITNGCTAGATLTMTSNSTTSNALTRTGSDSGVKTIATTTGTTALDNNSWGYSLDNGANYAGIPLKNGTAATIYSGSTAGSKTVNVLYGVKTDNNLPSGTYTTDVVYTAAVSPSCLTYTVHFDTDGGTTFPDLTLNYGDKINLTNYIPTKSGYVFAGYSNGTSTYTGTETAADVNQSNAFTVTLRASFISYAKSFSYTGSAQTWTVPYDGYYKVELWGASGGDKLANYVLGGKGGFVEGNIFLQKEDNLYIYVGQHLNSSTSSFNGGGQGTGGSYINDGLTGGGATDIRTILGSWNTSNSLRSRIMVASGGGGSLQSDNCSGRSPVDYSNYCYNVSGGSSGGLVGYSGNGAMYGGTVATSLATGGTQITGGVKAESFDGSAASNNGGFGYGGGTPNQRYGSGAGSGWYGGGSGAATSGYVKSGAGGSSYISGHTGAVGVTSTSDSSPKSGCTTGTTNNACSLTPYINPATGTSYTFTNTLMIDGSGYAWTNTKGSLQQMPNPNGGYYASGIGHSGNGAARITYLGASI